MSRMCSTWMDDLFSSTGPVPTLQVAAASGSPSTPQAQEPQQPEPQQPERRRARKQPLPPTLFEEVFLFGRRSVHQVFPSLVDAPILDALMANGLPDGESDDETEERESEGGSSPRPASSKGESGPEENSSTGRSVLASQDLTTLTIYGLPRKLDLLGLQEAFASAGFIFGEDVDYALIPKRGISREGGIPSRSAIVNFTSAELASAAKTAWHGKEVSIPSLSSERRVLRVEHSKAQGLDKNLKMNSTDAWLSTASTASESNIATAKGSVSTPPLAGQEGADGARKKTKRQNRSKKTAQWRGVQLA